MANEKRLIDANIMPHGQFWEGLTDKEKAKVLAYLVMSPTVDAVEVVHAYWRGNTTCSNCTYFAEDDEGHILMSYSNYCPNCGAKMDGGNEDG